MPKPRNAQPERKAVILRGKVKVSQDKATAVVKHAAKIAANEKLQACCRDVEESEVEYRDTDGNGTVDLIIITCNVCGRRQFIMAGGAMGDGVGKLDGVG